MPGSVPLSVVVITKNEATRLAECLDSVAWAGEIVIVDDESTDSTVELAKRYTDKVITRKMDIEGRHRNFAYAQTKFDWVLSLDADERVTPELKEEISRLLTQGNPAFRGYTMPRRNYIGKRWVKQGGWYPSPQLRLFRKDSFKYEESEVHPRAFMNHPCGSLKYDLLHYSYRDLSDFVAKLNRQSTLEARKWVKDGRKMSLRRGLWRTLDRARRTWGPKQAHKEGMLGFIITVFAGLYQFASYAKYWAAKNLPESSPPEGECRSGNARPTPAVGLRSSSPRFSAQAGKQIREGQPGGNQASAAADVPVAATPLPGAKLSVVILAKNAKEKLAKCLDSVAWVKEVIVVDGGSTDGTQELAKERGARVIVDPRPDDFGYLRNLGTGQAAGDWVLQLDADEIVTDDFRRALEKLTTSSSEHAAYKFRRKNRFLGRQMRYGGWEHDSLHLFRRGKARYEGRVHEKLLVDGTVGRLEVGVEHTPFRTIEEFIDRQNRYTTLEARQILESGQAPSEKDLRYQITIKPVKLFWKLYVKKGAFREGMHGLIFSGLFSVVHWLKWSKVWEKLYLCES